MADIVNFSKEPVLVDWKDRLANLKVGTCLVSSWACTLSSLGISLYAWDTPGKIVVGAAAVIGGFALTGGDIWEHADYLRRQTIEEAPKKLSDFVHKVSTLVGMKKPMSVHFNNDVQQGLHTLGDDIYFPHKMYNTLTPKEQVFLIMHETNHGGSTDFLIKLSHRLTKNIAVIPPFLAAGGLVHSAATHSSLSMAFLGASLAASCFLTPAAEAFSSAALRLREYAADRFGLKTTHDPISAMKAIYHVGQMIIPSGRPWMEPTGIFDRAFATHPTRNQRVLRLIDDFNEMRPYQTIIATPFNPAHRGPKHESRSLWVDATKFDGHVYRIHSGEVFGGVLTPQTP